MHYLKIRNRFILDASKKVVLVALMGIKCRAPNVGEGTNFPDGNLRDWFFPHEANQTVPQNHFGITYLPALFCFIVFHKTRIP
jgi:hypothetical protein